jgi:hypothetical protein
MDPMDTFDDSVCCTCGRALPYAPPPGSWLDHGFCDLACFRAYPGSAQLMGDCAVAVARLGGALGGPGFEGDLVRAWLAGARPEAPALLVRALPKDDRALSISSASYPGTWVWRLWSGGVCRAMRLTAIDPSTGACD